MLWLSEVVVVESTVVVVMMVALEDILLGVGIGIEVAGLLGLAPPPLDHDRDARVVPILTLVALALPTVPAIVALPGAS